MLFAGGQRQHETTLAAGVHGFAAQPARGLAYMLFAASKQAQVRPAKQQPGAERLAFAHHDIGAHFARRLDGAQRNDFGDHDDEQRAGLVAGIGQRGEIGDMAKQIGVLHDDAAGFGVNAGNQAGQVIARRARREHRSSGFHHVASEAGERLQHRGIVRVDTGGHDALGFAGDAARHEHRFCHGGGAVVHRGVGHFHAGEPRHLGLEFEQDLQGALRDFRLIGRVGGEEFAALDHHVHRGRHMMFVGAAADEEGRGAGGQILAGHLHQRAFHRHFAGVVREAGNGAIQHGFGRHVLKQIVDAGGTDGGQHGCTVSRGKGQITQGPYSGRWAEKRMRT